MRNYRIETLKIFYKVWSGYTKFIKNQIDKERVVECPLIGTFIPAKVLKQSQLNPEDAYEDDSKHDDKIYYIPNVDFMENLKLIYNEDNVCNLNPYYIVN